MKLLDANYQSLVLNFNALLEGDTSKCSALSFLKNLGYIFLAFFFLKFLVQIIAAMKLKRRKTSLASDEIRESASALAEKYNIARTPEIRVLKDFSNVAFVTGFFRPAIYLSHKVIEELCQKEMRCLLAHEFAHIKSRDTLKCLVSDVVFMLSPFILIQLFAHKFLLSNTYTYIQIVGSIVTILLFKLFFEKIFHLWREFRCDNMSAQVTGDKLSLASAILKASKLQNQLSGLDFTYGVGRGVSFVGISPHERRIRVLLGENDFYNRLRIFLADRRLQTLVFIIAVGVSHALFSNDFQSDRFFRYFQSWEQTKANN